MPLSTWAGLVLTISGVGTLGCDKAAPPPPQPKPQEVVVSLPTTREVTDYEDFTGHVEAVNTVEIRSRVTGYLDKANFKDGAEVKEGDVLFEIDPRPYQAELKRTEANLVQSEAHLKRLNADYQRAQALLERRAIGPEEFDKIAGDRAEAVAAVGVATASRDSAKLNVGFTQVRAPINGRISRRLIDPGNLVKADDTLLTMIVSQDPMYVYFDVDERTVLRLRRLVRGGKVKAQETDVPMMLSLADEDNYSLKGTINFVDNKVDPNTGTLWLRGLVGNPNRLIAPGLFVRVRVPVGSPYQALLIPEQALGRDQGQKFVYVVNDQNRVVSRPVKVGREYAGLRVVTEGLASGERVITSGLQRVQQGAVVEPKQSVIRH